MLLGYACAAIFRPLFQVDGLTLLFEGFVFIPVGETVHERRVLLATGGHHENAAGLTAFLKVRDFFGTQFAPRAISHYFWY